MDSYRGDTNAISRIELPSSLEQVLWTRAIAAVGGTVGLEVHTCFVGNGAELEVELSDGAGTKHGRHTARVFGDVLRVEIRVPPTAEKALFAKATLPKHGLTASSDALLLLEDVRVYDARWSQPEARRGDFLTLTATVEGAPDGMRADVVIWEHDAIGAHDLVTRIPAHVQQGQVETTWEFHFLDDTDDLLTDEDLEAGYQAPEYFFVVEVAGIEATSDVLRFQDWIEIELHDPFGEPYDGEPYVLHLADGTERNGTLDAQGTAREERLPPGPCWVDFPDVVHDDQG